MYDSTSYVKNATNSTVFSLKVESGSVPQIDAETPLYLRKFGYVPVPVRYKTVCSVPKVRAVNACTRGPGLVTQRSTTVLKRLYSLLHP